MNPLDAGSELGEPSPILAGVTPSNRSMFHSDPDYPADVQECLHPAMCFKAGTLTAMAKFKVSKPWRGTTDQRIAKFTKLVADLSGVYGIQPPAIDSTGVDAKASSGSSYYMPMMNLIALRGRLSVITLLHEFAHALGKGEFDACRWSLNLFRRVFPTQFEKLEFQGHVARRRAAD